MMTVIIDRRDLDLAKKACAEFNIEATFSEHTDNENKTLMVIPNELPAHEIWYLGRHFQLAICEVQFLKLSGL